MHTHHIHRGKQHIFKTALTFMCMYVCACATGRERTTCRGLLLLPRYEFLVRAWQRASTQSISLAQRPKLQQLFITVLIFPSSPLQVKCLNNKENSNRIPTENETCILYYLLDKQCLQSMSYIHTKAELIGRRCSGNPCTWNGWNIRRRQAGRNK